MGVRGIVAIGEERVALRQGRAAIDRAAERIDDAAEPGRRGAQARLGTVDMDGAAATDAVQPAEGHDQRLVAGEADDLAGNARARRDLDADAPAQAHRTDRPGDLDEQAAHADDAAIDRHAFDMLDGGRQSGEAVMAVGGRIHRIVSAWSAGFAHIIAAVGSPVDDLVRVPNKLRSFTSC